MKKIKKIILPLIFISILIILLQGCTTSNNPDTSTDLNSEEQKFVGTWVGENMNQQINISMTFSDDGTGFFQSSKIEWSVNNSILKIIMFDGESSSEYQYSFIGNDTTLTLTNIHNDEEFLLERQ